MTERDTDLSYVPIGPAECRYCPGVLHWPHECPHQPEAVAERRRRAAEVMTKIAAMRIPGEEARDVKEG